MSCFCVLPRFSVLLMHIKYGQMSCFCGIAKHKKMHKKDNKMWHDTLTNYFKNEIHLAWNKYKNCINIRKNWKLKKWPQKRISFSPLQRNRTTHQHFFFYILYLKWALWNKVESQNWKSEFDRPLHKKNIWSSISRRTKQSWEKETFSTYLW